MNNQEAVNHKLMIAKEEVIITEQDNYQTLSNKLSKVGSELLIKVLPSIFNNACTYEKQNEEEVTFAKIIKKEDEYLSFNDTTKNIYNKIRALSPEPCCYFYIDNERVKIYEAKIGEKTLNSFGKITSISKEGLGISTTDGEIIITKLQFPGKKAMEFKEYLNGIKKEDLTNKRIS